MLSDLRGCIAAVADCPSGCHSPWSEFPHLHSLPPLVALCQPRSLSSVLVYVSLTVVALFGALALVLVILEEELGCVQETLT